MERLTAFPDFPIIDLKAEMETSTHGLRPERGNHREKARDLRRFAELRGSRRKRAENPSGAAG